MAKGIILSKKAGYCFGVKRALSMALSSGYGAYTLGPLIHNPQVVKKLSEKGIHSIDSIDELEAGTLIIRSHGVPKYLVDKAINKGINIVDATCPIVKRVQDTAVGLEREGYQVVLVGEPHHPEVMGIGGNLKRIIIINSIEEAECLEDYAKLAVVAQTTQSIDKFNEIADMLKRKTQNFKVTNTICSATGERQKAAIRVAKTVDVMVVIGGHMSGNTQRLRAICSEITKSYHVETGSELKKEWFTNASKIGITAGASTPDWVIEEVMEAVKNES